MLIARQVIEDVAEVDVGALAERDQGREADVACPGPVEDGRDQRARLGNERQIAGECVGVGEAGIEAEPGRQQADAVRAEKQAILDAARVPSRPSSSTKVRTVPGGVQITARSGAFGRSDTLAWQAMSPSVACLGLTAWTWPANAPARRLRQTVAPTLPARSDAPITQTEAGSRRRSRWRTLTVAAFRPRAAPARRREPSSAAR